MAQFVRRQRAIVIAVGAVIAMVGVLGLALGWGDSSASPAAPASSTTTTPTSRSTSSSAKDETPEVFFALFTTAVKSDDAAFLLARAHPVVIARYGQAQCAAFVPQLADPTIDLRIVSVSGPDDFDYASDDLSVIVPDTYTFQLDGTAAGSTGPRDRHFALVDGKFRLFVDCGTPQ